MSTVHCGITKPPKGKKTGSMLECAKSKQIRLYGLYKVDPKIIESLKKKKKTKTTMNDTERGKMYDKIIKLKAKRKKLLEEDKKKKTSEEDKKKIKKEIKKIEKELEVISNKLKSYENKKNKK
jgi:hypothetical protein